MNTAVAPYPSLGNKDFAGKLVEHTRHAEEFEASQRPGEHFSFFTRPPIPSGSPQSNVIFPGKSPLFTGENRALPKAEMGPWPIISVFSSGPLAENAGIAEWVHNIAVGRSAELSPSLRQRIMELSKLNPHWDGEAAKSIKPHVLADVVEALKRFTRHSPNFREPFLAPTFDGYVQMEWHDAKRSLEVEAVDRGWSLVGAMTGHRGGRHYFTAECERSNFERLERFYEWFAGAELIWPSL